MKAIEPIRLKKPFSRLTAKEKRVAIARDVLNRHHRRQFSVEHGTWVNVGDYESNPRSLKEHVNSGNRCSVCALGAVMCSFAGIENKITIPVYTSSLDIMNRNAGQDGASPIARLKKFFPSQSLIMIEAAFEEGEGRYKYGKIKDPKKREAVKAFVVKFFSVPRQRRSTERFLAVFRNIVRNGDFKP